MAFPTWVYGVAIALAVMVLLWPEICRSAGRRSKAKIQESPRPDRSIFIDLDILRQIESGGNASAVSRAGARGPYQFMRPAWQDAARSIAARSAIPEPEFDYDKRVTDETISRAMAWEYLTKCLPRYLTATRLDATDVTGPVPDSLNARLAAWNAGALAVRRAYAKSPANWMAHLPFETREFISRYHREQAARAAAKQQSQI